MSDEPCCSCHINPPCHYCMDMFECTFCGTLQNPGEYADDDQLEQKICTKCWEQG
jgi:hypothetical protein